MKRKNRYILLAIIIANVLVFVGGRYWQARQKQQHDEMIRRAERYDGPTGASIVAFDEQTNRWLEEMKMEVKEDSLPKLTDAMEYSAHEMNSYSGFGTSFQSESARERGYYSRDIEVVLSNRRFRKVYEDLKRANRRQVAELLTKGIKENLVELHVDLKRDIDAVSQGRHLGNIGKVISIPNVDSYRPVSHPDYPPTRTGRRYAIFSYILLASLLELRDVRPAVEEVIEFAEKEYQLFNSIGDEAYAFKVFLLRESLYNPSLLLTATLCDPKWNANKRKLLEDKLVKDRKVVDWESRALEHDRDAKIGLLPVKPHKEMLTIRYYKGITDAEFNDFFGE